MRNPFVAAALKARAVAELARSAAIMCFQFGFMPRDWTESDTPNTPNKHSRHTVAQDKRDARKARNRARGKR